MEGKEKKTRDCAFIAITDPNTQKQLVSLVSCPSDATNFIFWYNREEPERWGLTIKSIPKKEKKDKNDKNDCFTSQHTWKLTWFMSEDCLAAAAHCKSLATDITGDNFKQVVGLFSIYKK